MHFPCPGKHTLVSICTKKTHHPIQGLVCSSKPLIPHLPPSAWNLQALQHQFQILINNNIQNHNILQFSHNSYDLLLHWRGHKSWSPGNWQYGHTLRISLWILNERMLFYTKQCEPESGRFQHNVRINIETRG